MVKICCEKYPDNTEYECFFNQYNFKMKIKIFFLLFVFSFFLISCSKDLNQKSEIKEKNLIDSLYKIKRLLNFFLLL